MLFHVERRLRDQEDGASGGGGEQLELPVADDSAEPADQPLQRVEQRLERSEQLMQQLLAGINRPAQPPPPAAPAVDPATLKQRLEDEFLRDPLGRSMDVANQAAAQQVQALRRELWPQQVTAAKEAVRGSNTAVFDKYRGEIEQFIQQQYAPEHWTDQRVWALALKSTIADHVDEIAADKERLRKAPQGPAAPSLRGSPLPSGGDEMTDQEKIAAKILNMTDDAYRAARKNYLSDQATPDTGRDMLKSSWADVVTLDGSRPRKARKSA